MGENQKKEYIIYYADCIKGKSRTPPHCDFKHPDFTFRKTRLILSLKIQTNKKEKDQANQSTDHRRGAERYVRGSHQDAQLWEEKRSIKETSIL